MPGIIEAPESPPAGQQPQYGAQPSQALLYLMGLMGAPNAASLLGGQPRPPIENLPEQGKVPSTEDPRVTNALGEAANLGVNFVGPPLKAAAAGVAGVMAKPAIRAAGAPLFDLSRLAELPNFPQFNLERYVPPRGVPAVAQALGSPENMARVNAVVEQGRQMGGPEWYNTTPLRDAFREELGTEKGDRAFTQYIDMVASTSPRSKVGENVRNASYYYNLAQQGQPMPALLEGPGNPVPAQPLPQPYGHIAQGLHIQNATNVMENGGFPVMQNPKPASFSQNLQGNYMPVTADTHNVRLLGLPRDKPAKTEYGYLEAIQQAEAAKMGITPAQYQASAWIGGGAQTGLKSTADPFVKVFEDRVGKTAEARGMTKMQVLQQFIRGQMPLLGFAGAGALGVLGQSGQKSTPE